MHVRALSQPRPIELVDRGEAAPPTPAPPAPPAPHVSPSIVLQPAVAAPGPTGDLKRRRVHHDPGVRHLEATAHAKLPPQKNKVKVDGGASGSYFRKLSSPADVRHQGIAAEVVLPTPRFDPTRQNNNPVGKDGKAKPSYEIGPLDRPSVYLGGRAGSHELDAGLSWDRVNLPPPPGAPRTGQVFVPTMTDRAEGTDGRDPKHRFAVIGGKVYDYTGKERTDVKAEDLRPNCAYRPYWRTTNGTNTWNNPAAGSAGSGKPDADAYFYPGETVKMAVKVTGRDQCELSVSGAGQSFSKRFEQQGFGEGRAQSFKRVHAVDQFKLVGDTRVGLEKASVLPTSTSLEGGHWLSTSLIEAGGTTKPFTVGTDTRGREWGDAKQYDRVFHRSEIDAAGGERFSITAGRR